MGVDAILLALEKRLTEAVRRVPVHHQLIQQTVEVRVAVELIATYQHAADLDPSKAHRGKRSRGGSLCSRPGTQRQRASQTGGSLQKLSSAAHGLCTSRTWCCAGLRPAFAALRQLRKQTIPSKKALSLYCFSGAKSVMPVTHVGSCKNVE